MKLLLNHIKNFISFKELRIFTLILLFLFGTSLTAVQLLFDNIKKQEIAQTEQTSTKIAESLKLYFEGILQKSDARMQKAEVLFSQLKTKPNPIEFSKTLHNLIKDTSDFEIMTFSDEVGNVVFNSAWGANPELYTQGKKSNYQDRKYFQTLKVLDSDKIVISEPITSKTTGHKIIVAARKRYDPKNEFKGIIVITILLDQLSKQLENLNTIPNSTLALYQDSNVLIARSPVVESAIGKEIEMINELKPLLSQNISTTHFQGFCPIDKVDKIYGLSKMESYGMRALWGKPIDDVVAKINLDLSITRLVIFILFLIFIVFLVLHYFNLQQAQDFHKSEIASAQLVSLGEVAGTIAHEINNPVTVIIAKTETMLKKIDSNTEFDAKADIEKIRSTAYRISQIVAGIKTLSHHTELEKLDAVDLKTVVQEIQTVLDSQLKKNQITTTVKIDDSTMVIGRTHQIGQVILNLFTNSIYAIKDQESPWITISAEKMKSQLVISFTDSGNGIPKEIQEKILEPYFTTKSAKHGTGLGLSISKKIITAFGGKFELDSKSPNTKFVITLNIKT